MQKLRSELEAKSLKVIIPLIILAVVVAALLCIFPIVMIVIGSIYRADCIYEPKIPAWLISFGGSFIFFAIVAALSFIGSILSQRRLVIGLALFVNSIIVTFLTAWLVVGSVWTFTKYYRVIYTDNTSPYYCEPTLYKFAFWTLVVFYILIGIGLLLGILLAIGLLIFAIIKDLITYFKSNRNHKVQLK